MGRLSPFIIHAIHSENKGNLPQRQPRFFCLHQSIRKLFTVTVLCWLYIFLLFSASISHAQLIPPIFSFDYLLTSKALLLSIGNEPPLIPRIAGWPPGLNKPHSFGFLLQKQALCSLYHCSSSSLYQGSSDWNMVLLRAAHTTLSKMQMVQMMLLWKQSHSFSLLTSAEEV